MTSIKGPKRKAMQLKVLAGTRRRDRDGVATKEKAPAQPDIPGPPSWLPVGYQGEFACLSGILASRGVMGESVPTQLAQYLAIAAKLGVIFGQGKIPSRSALTQFRSLARSLGLDEMGPGLEVQAVRRRAFDLAASLVETLANMNKVKPEMIEARALVIEKYSSREYDPFSVAEQVFRAMINRLGH